MLRPQGPVASIKKPSPSALKPKLAGDRKAPTGTPLPTIQPRLRRK